MKITKKLNELHDKINLKKKYPNYINRFVFWLGFISIILFICGLVMIYGFNSEWVSLTCESPYGCKNPYIECQNHNFSNPFIDHTECEYYYNQECIGNNCNTYLISEGDYIGTKPPKIVKDAQWLILLMIAFTFYVNHLVYEFNKGKK